MFEVFSFGKDFKHFSCTSSILKQINTGHKRKAHKGHIKEHKSVGQLTKDSDGRWNDVSPSPFSVSVNRSLRRIHVPTNMSMTMFVGLCKINMIHLHLYSSIHQLHMNLLLASVWQPDWEQDSVSALKHNRKRPSIS